MTRSTAGGGSTPQGIVRHNARKRAHTEAWEFFRKHLNTWEEIEPEAIHAADIECRYQSSQFTQSNVILTLAVPMEYSQAILSVYEKQGSYLFLRIYHIPPPDFAEPPSMERNRAL